MTERSGAWAKLLAAALLLVGLVGCEEDQVTKYESPPDPSLPSWARDDKPRARMLAAIVPHDKLVWYFKLFGPDKVLTAEAQNFEQFVRSIQFKDDAVPPVTWKLPAGWVELGPSEHRWMTIQIGPAEQATQLWVTPLPPGGSPLANAFRWAKELGYPEQSLTGNMLEETLFEHDMPYGKITVFDMRSVPLRGNPPSGGETVRGKQAAVQYDLPDGWKISKEPAGFAQVTLTAGAEGHSAEATVSRLSGAAGGAAANINRWRGQVQLPAVSEQEIAQHAKGKFKVAGVPAQYYRIDGPAAADGKETAKSILAVIFPHNGDTWFVKLFGPSDVVLAQEGAFVKFAGSLRFASQDPPEGIAP